MRTNWAHIRKVSVSFGWNVQKSENTLKIVLNSNWLGLALALCYRYCCYAVLWCMHACENKRKLKSQRICVLHFVVKYNDFHKTQNEEHTTAFILIVITLINWGNFIWVLWRFGTLELWDFLNFKPRDFFHPPQFIRFIIQNEYIIFLKSHNLKVQSPKKS